MKKIVQVVNLGTVLFFFAGCQIHRPVPVEHLPSGTASVHDVYDARQHQRPQTSRPVSYQPAPPSAENTQWAPINIVPVDTAKPEPTQPLTQYEFKPRPSSSRSASGTRPVATHSGYKGVSGYHIVNRGENLYSIARAYGIGVQSLAAYNQLQPPYEIYPNQKIYLNNQGRGPSAGQVSSSPGYTSPSIPPQPVASGGIQWTWPAQGSLIGQYVQGQSNGIQIAGEAGQTIRASADGTVLYSGNEVTGYGELIIIDHGDGYMSTYAHNRRLLVKQGARVNRGDKIAEMGSSEADRTKLHFEIRKGEKPVDPLAYLPQR